MESAFSGGTTDPKPYAAPGVRRAPQPAENTGMGLMNPVQHPGASGAADQSQPPSGMPQIGPPIHPLSGMSDMSMATPGGGGVNTANLMRMLMQLQMGSMGQGNGGY